MSDAVFAPVPEGSPENPMATDGFEFVEYTAPNTADLETLFTAMGFRAIARHRSKNVTCLLYTSPSPRDLSTSRMPSSA